MDKRLNIQPLNQEIYDQLAQFDFQQHLDPRCGAGPGGIEHYLLPIPARGREVQKIIKSNLLFRSAADFRIDVLCGDDFDFIQMVGKLVMVGFTGAVPVSGLGNEQRIINGIY